MRFVNKKISIFGMICSFIFIGCEFKKTELFHPPVEYPLGETSLTIFSVVLLIFQISIMMEFRIL